jgi:hypothetical protein
MHWFQRIADYRQNKKDAQVIQRMEGVKERERSKEEQRIESYTSAWLHTHKKMAKSVDVRSDLELMRHTP